MATMTLYEGEILINNNLAPAASYNEGRIAFSFVCGRMKWGAVSRDGYNLWYYTENDIGLQVADVNGWRNISYRTVYIQTQQTIDELQTGQFSQWTFNASTLIRDRTLADVEYAKSLIKKGQSNWTYAETTAWNDGLKGVWQSTAYTSMPISSSGLKKDAKRVYEALRYSNTLFALCGKTIQNFPTTGADIAQTFCLEFYNSSKTIGAPLLEALMDQFETQAPWSSIQSPDPEDRYIKPSIPVFNFTFVAANELEDRLYRYIKAGRAFMNSI